MIKYSVTVLPPKAKRLIGTGRIVVLCNHGWTGSIPHIYPLKNEDHSFQFELDDSYEYHYNCTTKDGNTFEVSLIYSNESGSRTEKIELVPEKLK